MKPPFTRFQTFVAALIAFGLMWPAGAAHMVTASDATPGPDATACPVTPYAAEIFDPSFSAIW